jgi:alpha-galactosidase
VHWGADLGEIAAECIDALALGSVPPRLPGGVDDPVPVGVVPEAATGWLGHPGLTGHRDGLDWSPSFAQQAVHTEMAIDDEHPADGHRGGAANVVGNSGRASGRCPRGTVTVVARDRAARLTLTLVLELTPAGLFRVRASVRNDHPTAPYGLDGLTVALPVASHATELLDLTGRWARERSPQRQPFTFGTLVRDGRGGRTGADAPLVLIAGTPAFGSRHGEVWGVHVAWSGNHHSYAERRPSGESVIGGGELLLPGEVRLAHGERYSTPWLYGSYGGTGLDEMSGRFHRHLRSRPRHPHRARPVVLNTWEAVYFDHDLGRLTALADAAAEVGVERFVLDDGWFTGRRSDRAGLGDWYVDMAVWPDGLHPLVSHVKGLGMEFGLWVEPEMISLDSDLAREHPDWILATGNRLPPPARHQHVLDLANPDAHRHILERLDALVTEYDLAYLKWDHNRDLMDAGRPPDGPARVHDQTVAVYRLLDELRARHPGLEFESCSSGGARVDLGILERTDRVWASDCNDALERQSIQRWTSLLVPPEQVGAHVGPPRSRTTGRRHDLSFRAGTAMFGHFGVEWDISAATPAERAELARWVEQYKRLRGLLHSGTAVHADHHDPALQVHGVVADDFTRAVFAVVATASGVHAPPGMLRLPGLNPDLSYRVTALYPGEPGGATVPEWMAAGIVLPGRVLTVLGVHAPALRPEHLILLELTVPGRSA